MTREATKFLNRHLPIIFSVVLIVAAAITAVFFLWDNGVQVSRANFNAVSKQPEIAALYQVTNPKSGVLEKQVTNDIAITLGDENKKGFEPKLTLERWGEVSMTVKPRLANAVAETKSLQAIGAKLQYEENGQKLNFYEHPDSSDHPGGAYEVEFVLDSKPNTNKFEMSIETQGLDFFYQPPLNQQDNIGKKGIVSCTETECVNIDGKVVTSRPENVVGSYAVYAKEKKNNYSEVGGKDYKTGKVFQIYRPQITDALGNKVWGELNINEEANNLAVTVPQDFLNTAAYPVIVDPTFGYSLVGATAGTISVANEMEGSGIYIAPADASTISSMSFYCDPSNCTVGNFKAVLVKESDMSIVSNGVGGPSGKNDGWVTSTFATPPSVTPGTGYVLMVTTDSAWVYHYDSIAAYSNYYDSSNNYTTPTNPTSPQLIAGDFIHSLYVTYTSTGTYPYWVSTGAQSAAANDSTTIAPALPTGWATNDLLLLVIAGRPENATPGAFSVSAGWTQQGSTAAVEVGTNDLSVEIWYRRAQEGDVAPTVTPHADYTCPAACTTAGYSAFIAAYRNVNTSSPFDVANVTSTSTAAATWTPTGVTTATNFALALSVVATADDNALELSTSSGFNTDAGAASYDTATGADHGVAVADYLKGSAGSVTMPVWRENVGGNDIWVGITTALRSSGRTAGTPSVGIVSRGAGTGWFSSGGTWGYRKQITVDHNKVTGTTTPLTNFPMLFSVTDSDLKTVTNGGKVGKDTGIDILFTSGDGTTKLYHELEKFASTTGETIAWVNIPSLSPTNDTVIFIYYGNASASDQQDVANTWDSSYKYVWHLPNGTSLTSNDSTSNALNGTTAGHAPTAATGKVDGGATFNGSNQYITRGDSAGLHSGDGTLSIWVKTTSDTDINPFGFADASGTNTDQYSVELGNSAATGCTDEIVTLFVAANAVQSILCYTNANRNVFFDGNWHYLVITADTSTKMYLDGASVQLASVGGATDNGTFTSDADLVNFDVGAIWYGGAYVDVMDGSLDEPRFSNIPRTAGWIATEYNNQSSPSTFYAYSTAGVQNRDASTPLIKLRGGVKFR